MIRPDGLIEVKIKGWSNTHVLFDYRHVGDKTWVRNFSRPILNFMLDFGLFGDATNAA